MSENVDRMWSIRDAILAWLYEEKAILGRPGSVEAGPIEKAVGWVADPIKDTELSRDSAYLIDMEYMSVSEFFHGKPIYPRITTSGENLAAQGISVRPGPGQLANITGRKRTYSAPEIGEGEVHDPIF